MSGINTKGNKRERSVEREAETTPKEYKTDGLPQTSKYSVDKKKKTEPSVSTPKDLKKQSGRPADANYGF